ncbi:MAG: hypothetical protein ACRBG0_24600 [Lewinella sp.]|uniref:hypothetical protein n=1 Tax=Lewinella sp. TaxID=2004506 RepID=UPI003D6BE243
MKKFHKILEGLKDKSPIPFLLENGYTPESIKAEIIQTFKPYFKNKANLEEYSIKFLVSDWINFHRMMAIYPDIENEVQKVLATYNEALSKDYEKTIEILVCLSSKHIESGNKYWSFLNMEVNKKKLEIYEYAKVLMEDISNIIEGLSKSLYVENVLINKIRRGKSIDIEKTLSTKLGSLIQDLIDNSPYASLFLVPSENIKLSDWRNIAAHHTYKIVDEEVFCETGQGDKKKNFIVSREGMFERLEYCMRTTEVLNMVHKIFGFDNLPEISERIKEEKLNARPEIGFLMFSSALMSQGFEILHIDYNSEKATLEIIDLITDDPRMRGIHSSQLLNQLWLLTSSKMLEIKYFTKAKQLYMTSRISSAIFEEIEVDKDKGVEYFAENVEFEINDGA